MHSQQAINEEVDHELLSNGMEFECEEYKFSAKNDAVPATTAAADDSTIHGAPTVAIGTTLPDSTSNDANKNLPDRPIAKEPNENDQPKPKYYLIVTKVPTAVCTPTITIAPTNDFMAIKGTVTSSASSIPATGITTNNSDKMNSTEEESNENKQQKNSDHLKTKKSPRRYTCKRCKRSFNRPGKLFLHIKDVHKGIRDHACEQCGKRCVTLVELRAHARTHTGEKPYICDECGISYAHSTVLANHKKSVHLGLRPHACEICEKRFITKYKLEQHLVTHTGEKTFACDLCDRKFNRKSILKTHKNRVHKQQIGSHPCPVCDKLFFNTTELKQHSLTHTGERPLTCEQCNKTFAQLSALKLHENTVHEEIRRYACSHCDKRFKRGNHLQQHLTIHTGEKAYTCDKCNKSFALGYHLSSHIKSVHQLKA